MDVNVRTPDPREHVNEEPRNDLGDLMNGFWNDHIYGRCVFGMVIIKFLMSE